MRLVPFLLCLCCHYGLVKCYRISLTIFIDDPRAILAYPSDSQAFYVAAVLVLVYRKLKVVDNYRYFLDILYCLMYVFLSASFVYEFVQIILGREVFTWGYIGLLAALLIIIILLQNKLTTENLAFLSILGWSLGQLTLSIFYHTNVFQFNLSPIFYSIIAIGSTVLFVYGKRVAQWEE